MFGRNLGDLELQRSSSKEDTYNDHWQQCARIRISVLNMDEMKIPTLFQGVVLRTKLQREEPSSKANTYDTANIEAFEVGCAALKSAPPFERVSKFTAHPIEPAMLKFIRKLHWCSVLIKSPYLLSVFAPT